MNPSNYGFTLLGHISVCLEQVNLFSYEQEITPLYQEQHEQTYAKNTFGAIVL